MESKEIYLGKLNFFNFISLDGYYKGPNEDISWHRHGSEENDYSVESLKSGSILLFGRVTYEMMASYWPTPDAIRNNPAVAEGMNRAEKIVFSRTLEKASWDNTRLIRDDIETEIKKLKEIHDKNLTLLGSGSIMTQLADMDLIDEYQFMVDPVVLGNGTPIFKDIKHKLDLKLIKTRTFNSGVILLCYERLRSV